MIKLSTVIIAFNEELNIGRCIDSVQSVSDEILVIDSYSTDKTVNLSTSKGAKVLQHHFEGYIEQKNYGLQAAEFDHVLSLDADEALSSGAQLALNQLKNSWLADAYVLNRRTQYCGKWINHCGWYPDRKTRLIDRRKGEWAGKNPHDKLILKDGGSTQLIKEDILHYSYPNLGVHMNKLNQYSTIAAQELGQKSFTHLWLKLIFDPPFHFFRNYVFKKGFLDGGHGLVICVLSGYMRFSKYAKAIFAKQNKKVA